MSRGPLTRSRLTTVVLLVGIAGFAGLYLASIGPYWNISPDSVDYVGWARSLAGGAVWSARLFQPPLTAFVFAGVVRLSPTGYTALNALTPLLIFLSLGFAYGLLARRGDRNVALLAVLLSLASIQVYRASTRLLSEPVYMVCSMAALFLLDGCPDRKGVDAVAPAAGPSRLRIWLAGILLVATALTRTIGIALALAVLLGEGMVWLRRRRRPSLVLVAFALVAVASIPLWQAYTGSSYASGWFSMFILRDPWTPSAGPMSLTELLGRIRDNIELLPRAGGMLLNGWAEGHKLYMLLQVTGTLAIVWGLVLSLRRRAGVTELYLGLYVVVIAAHMVVGGGSDQRFLVPVIPLLFYYALQAVRQVGGSIARARAGPGMVLLVTGVAALFLFGYLRIGWDRAIRGVAEAHYSPFSDSPIKRSENFDAQLLARWLQLNSGLQDRYAAAQRDMFDVLSERRGDNILLSNTHPREAFVARLDQGRVRYLLVDRTNAPLRDSLLAVVSAYPGRFRLIRELPLASLYEVTPKRKE